MAIHCRAVKNSLRGTMRMILSLVDNHFRQSPASAAAAVQRAPHAPATKRPRADSSTSYESGSESGLPISALTSFGPAPRFKAPASRQPPFPVSLGAAPVAAATPLQREAPVVVRGPPRQSLIVVLVIIYLKMCFLAPDHW